MGCNVKINKSNPYRSQIRFNGNMKTIGYYSSAIEAAEYWDVCARKIRRSPKFNFPLTKDLSHIKLPQWLA